MAVVAAVGHVLRRLGFKRVAGRETGGDVGCVRCKRQVIEMPADVIPPKLYDMAVIAPVVAVLGFLMGKYIPRGPGVAATRLSQPGRSRGGIRQVIKMPAGAIPPEFMDVVVIERHVVHMLGTLSFKRIGFTDKPHGCIRRGRQVVVMPTTAVRP